MPYVAPSHLDLGAFAGPSGRGGFPYASAMITGPRLDVVTDAPSLDVSPWTRISVPAAGTGGLVLLPSLAPGSYQILPVEVDVDAAFWGAATFADGNGTAVKDLAYRIDWRVEGPYADAFLRHAHSLADPLRIDVEAGDDVVLFARGAADMDFVYRAVAAAGGEPRKQADEWPVQPTAPAARGHGVRLALYAESAKSLEPETPALVVRSADPVTVVRDVVFSKGSDVVDTGDGRIVEHVAPEGRIIDGLIDDALQMEVVQMRADRARFASEAADAGWSHVEAYGIDPDGRAFQYGVQAEVHGLSVDEEGTQAPAAPCTLEQCSTPQARELLIEAGARPGVDVDLEMLWLDAGVDLMLGYAHLSFETPLHTVLARSTGSEVHVPGADVEVGPAETPRVVVPDLGAVLQILEPVRSAAEAAQEEVEDAVDEAA